MNEGVGILTAITFLPALGTLLIILTPREQTSLIRAIAHCISAFVLILSLFMFADLDKTSPHMQFVERFLWIPTINIRYYLGVDGLSAPLVVLTALLSFLSIVYSPTAIRHREKEYYALFLLLETGMIGVFTALDFVFFYIFWEVSLVPMYFLIGIWGGPKREYAAIKFFLYTLFGSVFMLLAILTLYYFSGPPSYDPTQPRTFDMLELIRQQPLSGHIVAQLLCFLGFYLAFAIKVPVFPFHTWLPDAHVEAPTAGSVLLAGVLLKMGTYGMVRVLLPMFPVACSIFWKPLAVLAIINIIYGALVAMGQDDLKKLVAYSSIAHMGFVMLGVAAAARATSDFANAQLDTLIRAKVMALNGATLEMIAHGLITGGLFLLVGVIYERVHHRDLNSFGGLWNQMPVYSAVLAFMALASLGLPGLVGFWAEFMALMGAFGVYGHFAWLAVFGIVIVAAFFLWMLQRMLMGSLPKGYETLKDMDMRECISLFPLVFLVFLLGVYPQLLLEPINTVMMHIVKSMPL